ncbi:MAG TPA: IS110 family transposase [Mycobacteriales bacterium]|nr:IS110 family transposase [Mycobacteriales bacterium]
MRSVTRNREPIHLGLDVHKDSITVGVLEPDAQAAVMTRLSSDDDAVRRLVGKFADKKRLKVCYEAGPTGFTLARTLRGWGVDCEVIAPSRIPKQSGDRVKTDKRDAATLAVLHRAGLLTPIRVPTEGEEALRDLCRARQDTYDDLKRVRRRLLAFLLRHGQVYRASSTWTREHQQWLNQVQVTEPAARAAFEHYLAVERLRETELDAMTRELLGWVDREPFTTPVHRLAAYRGVGYISALGITAEIGEWTRFARATGFMAFTGLVPSEYSSGERRHQGQITKAGNVYVRTHLVESAWQYRHHPAIGAELRRRHAHVGPDTVARSWKAQQRLCGRYRRMTARLVNPNVTVTAIARELGGFLWAEMTS